MKREKKRLIALLLFYAAAALGFLLVAGGCLVRNAAWQASGTLKTETLDLKADVSASSGIRFDKDFDETGGFVTTDPDAWFLFEWEGGRRVNRVSFSGHTLGRASGPVCLYYTTRPGETQSPEKMVWATQLPDGRWAFELGGRRVYSLRLDPATRGGAIWRTGGTVTLNAPVSRWSYFVPQPWQVFLLLFIPPLCWGVAFEVVDFVRPALARRRFEAKWSQGTRPDA